MSSENYVRVSIGSLARLGLTRLKLKYPPETLYMLQYSPMGCLGRCRYCGQSMYVAVDKKFLSRITWYPVKLSTLTKKLVENNVFRRLCLQSILKPGFPNEVVEIIGYMRDNGVKASFSVAINPVHEKYVEELKSLGVDYLGVGLDTATPELFVKYGKPYTWKTYIRFIENSLEIMGYRRVYVHLIVGLGEKPVELYKLMYELIRLGADIALFPYTGLASNKFNPLVGIEYYRSAQIIRYFLLKGYKLHELIEGDRVVKDLLDEVIEKLDKYRVVFYTSGCPHCNRPYYTENPRGPFYNIYSSKHYNEYRVSLLKELERLRSRLWGSQ